MKNKLKILSLSISFLGLLASCTKTIDTESINASRTGSNVTRLAGHNLLDSVYGGGTGLEGSAKSTFSIEAITQEDGTVTGHFNYMFRDGQTNIKGTINCLTIAGNKARIRGAITKIYGKGADLPVEWVGLSFAFGVQDNGEGNNADPDLISDFFIGSTNCSNVAGITPYIALKGNIKIVDN